MLVPHTSQKHCVYTITTTHTANNQRSITIDERTNLRQGFDSAGHYGYNRSSSNSTYSRSVGSQEEVLEFVKAILPETYHTALPDVWSDRFSITEDTDGNLGLMF